MTTAPNPDKVAWVVGASGGLGAEVSREFAAQGWNVAACHHLNPTGGVGEQIWAAPMNVRDRSQVEDVARQVIARWGRIDVLVNCAGVTADAPAWKISPADWDQVLAVNLKAAFLCAQAALGPMVRQRGGHIIHISSFAAKTGARGQASYAAAKAGLIGLTESLAREGASHNIRVNAVLPGVLATRMISQLTSVQLHELVSANVLGRINELNEVARFIVFLARMRNVSGQVFQLDSRIGRWT